MDNWERVAKVIRMFYLPLLFINDLWGAFLNAVAAFKRSTKGFTRRLSKEATTEANYLVEWTIKPYFQKKTGVENQYSGISVISWITLKGEDLSEGTMKQIVQRQQEDHIKHCEKTYKDTVEDYGNRCHDHHLKPAELK